MKKTKILLIGKIKCPTGKLVMSDPRQNKPSLVRDWQSKKAYVYEILLKNYGTYDSTDNYLVSPKRISRSEFKKRKYKNCDEYISTTSGKICICDKKYYHHIPKRSRSHLVVIKDWATWFIETFPHRGGDDRYICISTPTPISTSTVYEYKKDKSIIIVP
jgi:hypothetical protein